jgi:hypothetical protein
MTVPRAIAVTEHQFRQSSQRMTGLAHHHSGRAAGAILRFHDTAAAAQSLDKSMFTGNF